MSRRAQLTEQPIIRALTRVPMLAGVTYPWWGMMLLISTGGIVILKSFTWFFLLLTCLYGLGRFVCRYDVFFMDILMTRLSECPHVRNEAYWGCNSYEPW